MSKKPNFLVIGAARSGTTLLHSYFLQHPEIFVPKEKRPEPHYFLKSKLFENGDEWYQEKFFSEVNDEKAIGEVSTSYLFGERVPKRIYNYNSQMKFIVLLREPKARAFSNYWHSHKNGFDNLIFDEAVKLEEERTAELKEDLLEIAPYSYLGRSLYAQQLNRYLKYFDKSQFHICLFEDFIENPVEQLNKICIFLNIESKHPWKLIGQAMNKSVPDKQSYSKEASHLMDDLFKPDIAELAELFDLNLDAWK